MQTVDRNLILAARAMGASAGQRLLRVMLPATVPAVMAGVRLGGALVVVGIVVAEMLTSTAGIGYLITRNRTVFESPAVFLCIILVLGITLLLDQVIVLLERSVAGWSAHTRGRRALEQATGGVA